MGVTIHYKLGHKRNAVKATLDRTQKLAEAFQAQARQIDIPFTIDRRSDTLLRIDVGGCESLVFNFQRVREIKKEAETKNWSYTHAALTDDGKKILEEGYRIDEFPDNEQVYSAGFCKTQFARSIAEHRFIAELIRSVASYCFFAEVSDEGDYYHTGNIDNASEAIESNGKMIASLAGQLKGMGWKNDEINTNETTIKKLKK